MTFRFSSEKKTLRTKPPTDWVTYQPTNPIFGWLQYKPHQVHFFHLRLSCFVMDREKHFALIWIGRIIYLWSLDTGQWNHPCWTILLTSVLFSALTLTPVKLLFLEPVLTLFRCLYLCCYLPPNWILTFTLLVMVVTMVTSKILRILLW